MNTAVSQNVPMAEHTTLKVGGVAAYFVTVASQAELSAAVDFAEEKSLPIKILGSGSNLLVGEDGFAGLVIKLVNKGVTTEEGEDKVLLKVAAGEMLDDVVAMTVEHGWWGLENLSHIPGTIGATPVQNVGAYGVETKDLLVALTAYDTKTKNFVDLTNEQCQFGYRDSIFKKELGRYVILSVTLQLSKKPDPKISYKDLAQRFSGMTPELSEIRKAIIEIRSQKFPDWTKVGTAGSFFKNPIIKKEHYEEIVATYPDLPRYEVGPDQVKIPLGFVFDKILNLRGYREGGVGTYEGQALVLVNYGQSNAKEIEQFANKLADKVKEKLGIKIEWEVTKW